MLEIQPEPTRKIIQIAVTNHQAMLVALCDDGSVWYNNAPADGGKWGRLTLPNGFAGS